jgi:SrtB family sortase
VLEDLHLSNRLEEKKKSLIQGFMLAVRSFNEKHRATAKVVTVLALVLIALLSALFSCAIFVCSLFEKTTSVGKRVAGIAMAAILLCIAVFASHMLINTEHPNTSVETIENALQTVTSSDEKMSSEVSEVDETDSSLEAIESPDKEPGTTTESTTQSATNSTPTKSWNTADIDLKQLMDAYPEMVGWVYFEDGHISYPIMQTSDNEKYRNLDYMGGEAPTGAIFLDYRSAADFTDANSIIYGHNMKDGTMFGSLREYRKDPAYYSDHMYFQVITPDKAYRYLIFEYMDVAENYVLYDYVSDAALEFVKDAEPVRIKSYMDSEIPVKEDSKVVTLSTCTRKDDLQFVVLGVLVEEDERYN